MSHEGKQFSQSGIEVDAQEKIQQVTNQIGLFNIMTANQTIEVAIKEPDPVYLYQQLILENGFTIIFADPGAGKTVFSFNAAIQIAEQGYTTAYFDLELSRKQFQKRYTSTNGNIFKFPENLFRIDFARLSEYPQGMSYENFFFDSLNAVIDKTGSTVIFIDNLTKLAAADTDTAKATIPIIERLNKIKLDMNLTVVALEHNKKVDPTKPIHLNDLQGSKMKSNLVDAVFSIGKSAKDKSLRYIKQLKDRDNMVVYDSDNVLVCELVKEDYLQMKTVGYSSEVEHLKPFNESDKSEKISVIIKMKQDGISNSEIARRTGVSEGTIRNWLKAVV